MNSNQALTEIDKVIERYTEKQKIVDIVKIAYGKIKHHKQLTKVIETEIKKLLPSGYMCYYDKDYSQVHIKIWGNGIDNHNSVYFCMSESKLSENWNTEFEYDMARTSVNDYIEELQDEKQYFQQLAEMENKIIKIREEANKLKKSFIPKSATLRKCDSHWESFSYSTQKLFPITFDWHD